MDQASLDDLYTLLCERMTDLGEARAQLFLSRFALLAIARELEPAAARRLIEDAEQGLTPAPAEA